METTPLGQSPPLSGSPSSRWKVMDVVFLDQLRRPRGIVLDVYSRPSGWHYTIISESEGYHGNTPEQNVMATLEEWEKRMSWAADELTGRDFREIMAAARAPFTEPDFWAGYRERYAATGDPWLPHPSAAKSPENVSDVERREPAPLPSDG